MQVFSHIIDHRSSTTKLFILLQNLLDNLLQYVQINPLQHHTKTNQQRNHFLRLHNLSDHLLQKKRIISSVVAPPTITKIHSATKTYSQQQNHICRRLHNPSYDLLQKFICYNASKFICYKALRLSALKPSVCCNPPKFAC